MIKNEFKNVSNLKDTSTDKPTSDTDHTNAITFLLALTIAVIFLCGMIYMFWPKYSLSINTKFKATEPLRTYQAKVDKEIDTTTIKVTYGKERTETLVLEKDDNTFYSVVNSNVKGDFETYSIKSATDERFDDMKNAIVNVSIAKIQDDAPGAIHFDFNPGTLDYDINSKDEDINIFDPVKDEHREIYLKIK